MNIKGFIKEAIETILFVLVMVIIIRFFIGEIRWIPSASMRPTLLEGDRLFVERYSRFYKAPQRGDIIVFYPPDTKLKNSFGAVFSRLTGFLCKDIAYIKRVVAIAGDTVLMQDGKVFLKEAGEDHFELVEYEGVKGLTYYRPMDHSFPFEFTVSENHVYVLGDNRENSRDSRVLGEINLDNVDGVVTSFMIERKDGKLGDFCGWFYQTRKSIHDFLFGEE